jgi:hypothetical protein
MTRHKRNIFRKILKQENYGPRQELDVSRNMTRRTGVARREVNYVREYSTRDNIAPISPKGGTFLKRRWKGRECKNGIRDRGLKLHLRRKREFNKTLK